MHYFNKFFINKIWLNLGILIYKIYNQCLKLNQS